MSDDRLRAMVASTQQNVSQFMEVLQTKVLAIEQDMEETARKLDEVRGAKEMLTELLRHAGFTPPPLVFHSAGEGDEAPTKPVPQPYGSQPPVAQPYGSQPPVAQPDAISNTTPGATTALPTTHHHPPPLTYAEASRAPQPPAGHHNPHPGLPPSFYPRIREVRPSLQTVPEDQDGEAKAEAEQRIRERVLGRRRTVHNPLQQAKADEQHYTDSFSHRGGGHQGDGGEVKEAPANEVYVNRGGATPGERSQQAPRMSAADLSSLTT